MIKAIALDLAEILSNILDSKENMEIYAYALELLFMVILNLTLVILAAFYLRIVPTTLAFLAVFIPFRGFGGGVHMSTFPRCLVMGSLLMLGSAYLAARVNIQPYQLDILLGFGMLFTLLCTVLWVPANKGNDSVNNTQRVHKQKRNMFIGAAICIGCIWTLIYFNHNTLAFAMVLGAIVSTVLISPLGFILMGVIDRILNNLGKGVTSL